MMNSPQYVAAPNTFTVRHAARGVHYQHQHQAKRQLVPFIQDRTDLDMRVQRHHCKAVTANRFLTLVHKDYEATSCTRRTQQHFLHAMLVEVQRYQHATFAARVPLRALLIIQERMLDEMTNNPGDDCYAGCLGYLASLRVYGKGFLLFATEMSRAVEPKHAV